MELIEGVAISNLCDYSFGDQSGQWSNIYTSFMKQANTSNAEFIERLKAIESSGRKYMTVFIDNIRLYKRHITEVKESDRPYVESLMETSDLLKLCSNFPGMSFIVFTNLEDTPIDDYVYEAIPANVKCVCAVNAISNGGKVKPMPYGLQRRLHPGDNRNEIILRMMQTSREPSQLLFVCHSDNTHPERAAIKHLFIDKSWADVSVNQLDFETFLNNMAQCKFVICPRGNAIDCHRNWEVMYMRRVPVMKRHPYLELLFNDYPVLFVDDYSDVTEQLLLDNDHLFEQAKQMDLTNLTLPKFFNNIVNECIA